MMEFHAFTQLPIEIQDEIWRLCLPYRVCELDPSLDRTLISGDGLQDIAVQTCDLRYTSCMNAKPPAIAYVCRASRKLAFKAGGHCVGPLVRRTDYVAPSPADRDVWLDPARDVVHMNWTTVESHWLSILETAHPVHYLASESESLLNCGKHGPLRISYLEPSRLARLSIPFEIPGGPSIRPSHALSSSGTMSSINNSLDWYWERPDYQLPNWPVVTRIVVVHCDWKTAAATGLFGHLGDAWIQIVDKTDNVRLDKIWKLVEQHRPEALRQCRCDGPLKSPPMTRFHFRQFALTGPHLWSEEMARALHPAIMFRLCTRKCTHAEYYHRRSREESDKRIAQRASYRGRGRGRGRGRAS